MLLHFSTYCNLLSPSTCDLSLVSFFFAALGACNEPVCASFSKFVETPSLKLRLCRLK